MKVSAIICEFNPFHSGHKYLIDTIKSSGSCVISIMSGFFVQRGDISILSKYQRAETALKNGVDLVIELPSVFSCAGAERFAKSGIAMAEKLGCVDELWFGSESGRLEQILQAANASEDPMVLAHTKNLMKQGIYYPKALQMSVRMFFGSETADILNYPNNILGIEYCKALKGTSIMPKTTKRIGAPHDWTPDTEQENFKNNKKNGNAVTGTQSFHGSPLLGLAGSSCVSSAARIRDMIKNGDKSALQYMCGTQWPEPGETAYIERLEKVILYKLKTMNIEDFKLLPDVSGGLEYRILKSVLKYRSVEQILTEVKTKRYPHARLRRMLIHSVLNITKSLQNQEVPYIRILGFNKTGGQILKKIKNKSKAFIITKVSSGYKNLNEEARKIFDTEQLAADLFYLALDSYKVWHSEFSRAVITIDN